MPDLRSSIRPTARPEFKRIMRNKLRVQLTALNEAKQPSDLATPLSWGLHRLQGSERHWSIWVNGNYRLTFTFEGEDAVLLDYRDYH